MTDLAFIRLNKTIESAIFSNDHALSNIFYFDQIQLSPTESYTQLTNLKEGIAFDGNYSVYICDCEGLEILDITANISIIEGYDNRGKQQINFTISPILIDYYKQPLILRFKHTVSDEVWYSNIITITDYRIERTVRFDYLNYHELDGTAYNRFFGYNSIRVSCLLNGNDYESESKGYVSQDGIKVTSRVIKTDYQKLIFPNVNNLFYRSLNHLFINSVVYLNYFRVTDKQTFASISAKGRANLSKYEIKVAINYNENINDVYDFDKVDFDSVDFNTN